MEKIPKFKTVKEESEFWESHSPLDFPGEFEDVKGPIVDRRGRKKGIYIRIDPEAIELARNIGAELGVGYQTLFRMWIMEGLSQRLSRMVLAELPPQEQRPLGAGLRRVRESKVAEQESRYRARSEGAKLEATHGRRPS